MKRALLVSALAAFFLAGCSGGSSNNAASNSSPNNAAAKQLKVALLTPGPVSDQGWCAMAYDGLQQIKTQLGAQVNNQEAKGTQIKDAMRSYAQHGYDLVIGHGFEYNAPEVEVAKDFPKTVFISSSGGETAPNAGAFRFYLEQGFYLAGMMAAKMSKTGTLGMVGGPQVASIESTFKAFEAGAKAANPNIKVIKEYTGQDADVAAAKQATLTEIQNGADFIIHQANAAASGVFEACKEKGVYAIGSNLDQNSDPSGIVIASAIIKPGPAFVEIAKQVQAGAYKGGITLMGMDKGNIDFIWNPSLKSKVPADVLKLIDDTKAKITSGELTVPMDKF